MRVRASHACAALALLLAGCVANTPAPVIERIPVPQTQSAPAPAVTPAGAAAAPSRDYYTVKKGDTLYSIALDHGQDYQDVAAWNRLDNPNVIRIGQSLRVTSPDAAAEQVIVKPVAPMGTVESKPLGSPATGAKLYKREPKGGKQPYSEQAWAAAQRGAGSVPAAPEAAAPVVLAKADPKPAVAADPVAAAPAATATEDGIEWSWPVNGKLIGGFSESASKGVDIAGQIGDPVLAAAAGRVVYSGEGLRGYGRLVIIKHNQTYLSAYAHNSQLLVKEGQNVAKGQKIAEIGRTDSDLPKLHFEIRRQGKPVDPLKYLPGR